MNLVGKEFWLIGKVSRASADGQTWRDLPAAVPEGSVIASDTGTLACVNNKRSNLLRSTDGGQSWQEVFTFEMAKVSAGAHGMRAVVWGLVRP